MSTHIYSSTNEYAIDAGTYLSLAAGKKVQVTFHFRDVLLKPDVYRVGLWFGKLGIEVIDWIRLAGCFSVEPLPESSKMAQHAPGIYRCRYTAETVPLAP